MCGRYAIAMRLAQIRALLEEDDMSVDEFPDYNEDADGEGGEEEDEEDNRNNHNGDRPRQSYNFAPGYYGVVYRADTPDRGAGAGLQAGDNGRGEGSLAGQRDEDIEEWGEEDTSTNHKNRRNKKVQYKLQSMKWGLIPFWTKHKPAYGSMLKTINCRDDSLLEDRGLWNSMKRRKRCIVVAQGFYEWLTRGKEKVPHFVRRRDGRLMCWAGLWDCVQYENSEEKLYTYTIITTAANAQLSFLHDRMPVIFDNGSADLRTWLDPARSSWTSALQDLLQPYAGKLDVYPVSKDVGKVGNNSPTFMIPVASTENKSNIANYFAKAADTKTGISASSSSTAVKSEPKSEDAADKQEAGNAIEGLTDIKEETGASPADENMVTVDHEGTENKAPLPVPKEDVDNEKKNLDASPPHGVKREHSPSAVISSKLARTASPSPQFPTKHDPKPRSATSNQKVRPSKATPKKAKSRTDPPAERGSQKITSFFASQ